MGLTLWILYSLKAVLSTTIGNPMLPAGADSGASTSFTNQELETALSLPDNQAAPDPLINHVKKERWVLFHVGRKIGLPEKFDHSRIEPLRLDSASVGYCKALLERVKDLQVEHYNGGNHLFFFI